MFSLILACFSFHSNPMISLSGFKNLKSCQTAGEKAQKQFTQDIDITNGVAYNKCSYICIDQSK